MSPQNSASRPVRVHALDQAQYVVEVDARAAARERLRRGSCRVPSSKVSSQLMFTRGLAKWQRELAHEVERERGVLAT